jgi:hypothetical protein
LAKLRTVDSWTRAEKDAARAVLLEKSPYETDGGELIGRDPRKVSVEEFKRAGIEGTMIGGDGLEVVRAKCFECCVHQPDEVRKCVAITCVNWPYRMNANPFRKHTLTDEERVARGARLREGRKRRAGEAEALAANGDNSAEAPEGQG